MKRWTATLLALVLAVLAGTLAASQEPTDDQRALRTRVEDRYEIVPLTDGVALRPKARMRDVRFIEISDGAVAVNGVPVSGKELSDRVGGDADLILKLSYLTGDQRRALFGPTPATVAPRAEAPPRAERDPTTTAEPSRRARRASGDRVRIFGDVTVHEDEEVTGDVVAVIGSVRIDGEVGGEAIAVLGSVNLGPNAVVRRDIVSVGGRVRRAAGAQARGGVTEVSLGDPGFHVNVGPWVGPIDMFGGFGAVPRLIGSTFRVMLLVLLAAIALVVARGSVEGSAQRVSDNPAKAILVGLAASVLIWPVLLLTIVVLAISIIGIPLLLLLPFVIIFLILMAVVGFTGTAYAVGQATRRRTGFGGQAAFADVVLGILVILSPLLIGRVVALAGWPANPFAWLFVGTGFAIEFVAWSMGFGAVLTNAYSRWRATRQARATASPAAQ